MTHVCKLSALITQCDIYDKRFDRDYVGRPFYLEEQLVRLLSDGDRKSPLWDAILGNVTI